MASNESRIEGFGDKLVNNTRDMDVSPITTNKAKEDNETNLIVVIEKDEVKLEISTDSDEEIKKCAYCERPGPVYKCVKNHSQCNGKLFCDRKCNKSAHREVNYKTFMDHTMLRQDATQKKRCLRKLFKFKKFSTK